MLFQPATWNAVPSLQSLFLRPNTLSLPSLSLGFFYDRPKTSVVKMGQPFVCQLFLFGCIALNLTAPLYLGEPSTLICRLRPCVLHTAVTFASRWDPSVKLGGRGKRSSSCWPGGGGALISSTGRIGPLAVVVGLSVKSKRIELCRRTQHQVFLLYGSLCGSSGWYPCSSTPPYVLLYHSAHFISTPGNTVSWPDVDMN